MKQNSNIKIKIIKKIIVLPGIFLSLCPLLKAQFVFQGNRGAEKQTTTLFTQYSKVQAGKTHSFMLEDSIVVKDSKYYLAKSKRQKTAARILSGGGIGVAGAGLITGAKKNANFDDAETGGIIAAVGLVAALGSIPFFISYGISNPKHN